MKSLLRIVYISVFFIAIASSFQSLADSGVSAAEQYNNAGALYRDGKFSEALYIYEDLIRSGIANPDLFYNASNAAYRKGSPGKAILYLERALKLAPSDKEVLANLAYLNSIKEDREPVESNVVLAFLARRYTAITVNSAAIWSGIMFALTMALVTCSLFFKAWKKGMLLTVSMLCGLLFFLSTVVFIEKAHHNSTVVEGVIIAGEAPGYSGPGTENTHIFTLHEGTKIIIERTQDPWNLIRLKSGAGGWINAGLMEQI